MGSHLAPWLATDGTKRPRATCAASAATEIATSITGHCWSVSVLIRDPETSLRVSPFARLLSFAP